MRVKKLVMTDRNKYRQRDIDTNVYTYMMSVSINPLGDEE